jgi:hypothetical protein
MSGSPYKPISPATLMGERFLPELAARLDAANIAIQEFEERYGRRVLKGSVEVAAKVKVSFVRDPKLDEASRHVTVSFETRLPKPPVLQRAAYLGDDGQLMVETTPPSDASPSQQGELFPGGLIRIHGRQVDPATGVVIGSEAAQA